MHAIFSIYFVLKTWTSVRGIPVMDDPVQTLSDPIGVLVQMDSQEKIAPKVSIIQLYQINTLKKTIYYAIIIIFT